MTRERLIPVRSESELRIGAKYVLKGCRGCAGVHEFALLGQRDLNSFCPSCGSEAALLVAPDIACDLRKPCPCLSISEGRLFRVEDGLEQQSKATTRELERTR